MRIITFIQLFVLSFLISCVGTVSETVTPENRLDTGKKEFFNFTGIVVGRAISHSRIEIEFIPRGGEIEYLLYLNDAQSPVKLDPNSLVASVGGKLMYTLENLATNTEYKIKLAAKDLLTGATSTKENVVYVRTFDNQVADFGGIAKVALSPGSRTSSMDLNWIAPKMSGLFAAQEFDPVCYQVTYITDVGGAHNLNNKDYKGDDRIVVYVPECMKETLPEIATPTSNPSSTTIGSLKSNTRYYFQVRAINKLYYDYIRDPNVTDIPVNVDSNTKFLNGRTDPANDEYYFEQDQILLKNADGINAFDKINVFWKSGSGNFDSYRVFVKKYLGAADPATDDELTEDLLISMNGTNNFSSALASATTYTLSGLETGAFYQVKVALCKTMACPIDSADPNGAIISELRAIQVVAKLANFSGITNLENPGQFSQREMVNLKFDPPIITDGYATDLEFYCVDPSDYSQMTKFDSTGLQITGSPISRCNGLYLDIAGLIDLSTYKSQKVKNIIANGTVQYCFAATPLIKGYGPDQRIPLAERIVRCSYPEVTPPTLEQFPGITNSCTISGRTSDLYWNLPNGGIYSGFKVYWREKIGGSVFSYADAIDGVAGYSMSASLPAATTNFQVTGLIPGKTYQFGVLAITDMPHPATTLYSEYNLNVLECNLPLPLANFKGFSRIFALGPKVDGRVPNDYATKASPLSARIYEAIDSNGIPFEIAMDDLTSPSVSANFRAPPGRDFGIDFNAPLDGIKGDSGYAMSKSGIISLAWEEVYFASSDINDLYTSEQPVTNVPRPDRKWGYRVYRSHDNKLTWQNITSQSGVIFSKPHSYFKRSNVTATDTRMAFFTDYSVKNLNEVHDAVNGRDVDRARTYYYKIVPIFDGKELSFVGNAKHNIVKVTLPPPNMALVHRWMANRSHCFEMDKNISLADNYSCSYNGLGSTGQSLPFRTGTTKFDQSGDLLVDRFELGCRYTRGDLIDNPDVGVSHFDRDVLRRPSDKTPFPLFQGYRTIVKQVDNTTPFKGCIAANSRAQDPTLPGYTASYNKVIHGDCSGAHGVQLFHRQCDATEFNLGLSGYWYNIPGLPVSTGMLDCQTDDTNQPTTVATMIDNPIVQANYVMQSEFLGVYYNQFATTSERTKGLLGPVQNDPAGTRLIDTYDNRYSNQCTINLASIDADGFMRPRWMDVNQLGGYNNIEFKGTRDHNFLEMTVNQITEVSTGNNPTTFFNGIQGELPAEANFKLPESNLRNSPRYRNTTQLGRIMTSNSAKLPPLIKMEKSASEALCRTGWVQVGIANDDDQFAATSPVKNKRLIRRSESVTASAWPDNLDEKDIKALEANIPNTPGSCNTNARDIQGSPLTKGSQIGNRSTIYTNGPTNPLTDVPLITGSSPYNSLLSQIQSQHTEMCNSKYGIQDLVGNVAEVNSERIFCDYSGDQIFLGPAQGSWSGGNDAINKGDGNPKINFFNNEDQRTNWYVLHNGPATALDLHTSFTMDFTDATPSKNTLTGGIRPWVERSTDSGYCSLVDSDATTRTGSHNFHDPAGLWSNLFLPGGALNTVMVPRSQPDQESILRLRNGDGFFLDFGPNSLLPALNLNNSNALIQPIPVDPEGVEAQGKYFNPVVGMPLKCNATSCSSPLLAEPNDAKDFSITNFEDNLQETDTPPSIDNFPIGNSQITNQGVSGFSTSGGVSGILNLTVKETNSVNPYKILTSMTINPATNQVTAQTSTTYPDDYQTGQNLQVFRIAWDIPRNSNFSTISGGSSRETRSGRYTANINARSGYNELDRGVRCAVMINED